MQRYEFAHCYDVAGRVNDDTSGVGGGNGVDETVHKEFSHPEMLPSIMTCCVGYLIPDGCVLACDGRVTNEATWDILSDSDNKFGIFGSIVCVYAGTIDQILQDLQRKPPRSLSDFRKRIIDKDSVDNNRDCEFLAYDTKSGVLARLDRLGDCIPITKYSAIGTGGPYSLGVFDATKEKTDLVAAQKLCRRAVKAAIRRNASCGGKIKTITVVGGAVTLT